ncbi:MAG TPA: hypothetical protein VKU00_28600 [Chthonomonadaceae bacterium]|nr:hypothetical protein [Chthonomonadaceae bacterium]
MRRPVPLTGHFDGYNDGVIGTASAYYGNGLEGQAAYDGGTLAVLMATSP